METVTLTGVRCQRCGHVWKPLYGMNPPPRVCPKCHSCWWDTPKDPSGERPLKTAQIPTK